MTIPRGELEAVVRDGLVSDIFRLERAESILGVIDPRASEINLGAGHFGNLFGALQTALTTEAIMSIARIFDVPSKRYPTRCILGILEYLREHEADLPSIREPYQLKLTLQSMQAPELLEHCAEETPGQFAVKFSDYIETLLNDSSRQESLTKLRDLRDKGLAHNEHVTKINGPTWIAIADFTAIAKQVVGVLGWAYFSTAYMINGEYILTNDAKSASRSLNRMLDHLYHNAPAKK
jgi:hypothetical protein